MKKTFFLLNMICLILASCSKNDVSDPSKSPSQDVLGLITLLAQKSYDPDSSSLALVTYDVEGKIQSPYLGALNAVNLDAGSLKINGYAVSETADFIFKEQLSNGGSYYGAVTNFEITGNPASGVDSFTESFYVPTEITMSSPSTLTLSKAGSNKITWNADVKNTEPVFILIQYKGTQSHNMDPSLPIDDILFEKHVSDNGSYIIPTSALSDMPLGGYIEITIGRRNYKEHSLASGKHIAIVAETITYQDFKLLP